MNYGMVDVKVNVFVPKDYRCTSDLGVHLKIV